MALPSYTIRIGGVDVTEHVLLDGINVSAVANGLDHCTLNVASYDASLRPTLNQEVEIEEDDGTSPPPLIFGGLITAAREGAWGGQSADGFNGIVTQVTAHSYDLYAKRRVVNESRPAETLKARITAFTTYLAGYGVTMDPAQATGPSLPAQDYQNRKLNDVFDELSTQTANFGIPYLWEIDANKVLRFYQVGSIASPLDLIESLLTTTLAQTGDVEVEPTQEDYANRILLKVGGSQVHPVSESFTGDGVTTTFALGYQLTGYRLNSVARGYVTDDGIFKTLDLAANTPQWTYDPATNSLIDNEGAPANGVIISIDYDAQFPYTVIAEDASEISVNGIVELIIETPNIYDRTVAQNIANAELARHLETLRTVTWTTRLLGYKPGQRLTVTLPKRNINGLCLITEVITEHEPESDGLWRRITAVEGSQFSGSWRNLYLDWLGLGTTSSSAGAVASAPGGGLGTYFYFGSVHPQGFQVAPLGATYIRDDGRHYRKLGGGTTAYGWFLTSSLFEHGQFGAWASANAAGGAVGAIGIGATNTGTMSQVNASTRGFYGNVARILTASTINSNANLRQNGGSTINVGNEFDLIAVVWLSADLTSQRIWVGLDENGGAFNNGESPGPGIARYAFRFSSVAGDSGWVGQVSDGTTTTTTAALKAAVASTRYLLRIRGDRSAGSPGGTNPMLYFSVDNGPETAVSGIPSADEQLEWGLSIYNTAASARSFDFEKILVLDGSGMNEAI